MKFGKVSQIKMGAILSYVSIAINIIAGLLYTPWMVEKIGQGDYGLYTLANSLITLFLVDFGLSAATSRYISKYCAEGKQEKVNNFLGAVYKLYLIIDAVIFIALIVVYFLIDSIYVKLTPAEIEKFKVVYVIASLFAVINFPFVTLNGVLNAYEKFIQLKLADIIYRVLLVAITVVMLLLGYGLFALVAIHAAVGLVAVIYKLIVVARYTPVKVNWAYRERKLYREIIGFSVWTTVSSLAQRLIFNTTPSILGIVANSAAIAVFGIVVVIEGYVYTVTTAINGMFMPRISRIYGKENAQKNIMPLMIKVGRLQYALNGLIVAGFLAVGKEFITLWMDSTYIEAYYGVLLVIVPGLFFNSLQIANTAMVVEKKVKTQAIISVIMGGINIVLSLILSKFFGVTGACVSIFVAYIFRAVAYIIVYQRVMQFDMRLFVKQCYLKMSPPIIISILTGITLNRFLQKSGLLFLVLKGGLVTAVYFLSLWLFALSKSERERLLQFNK